LLSASRDTTPLMSVPVTKTPPLIRVLRLTKPPMIGADVEAVRRATSRFLHADIAWAAYQAMPQEAAMTFGGGMRNLVVRGQLGGHLVADGIAGPAYDHMLRTHGAYDTVCDKLLAEYAANHPVIDLWYPQVNGPHESVGPVHTTEGIPGNMARDFIAPGGTVIVAPFAGVITELSGHDPATGTHGPYRDVFGWSTYLERADGVEIYMTHQGYRSVKVGQKVKAQQPIGSVGHWPGDPGRSHTHAGVTSPRGTRDATAIINAIAAAPKTPAV
jgi:hypothetical protein